MKDKINFDRELKGPDSYEFYNDISKECQRKYLGLMKWQLSSLMLIAIISLFPFIKEWPHWIEQMKQITLVISILAVLILMIIQYSKNYMEGWQKSRFLAESILSNSWLLFFKHEKYNLPFNDALEAFHKRIKEMKEEIDVKQFLSTSTKPNCDQDIPIWVKDNFDISINDKKEFYDPLLTFLTFQMEPKPYIASMTETVISVSIEGIDCKWLHIPLFVPNYR